MHEQDRSAREALSLTTGTRYVIEYFATQSFDLFYIGGHLFSRQLGSNFRIPADDIQVAL
jgi:hypothetical protein